MFKNILILFFFVLVCLICFLIVKHKSNKRRENNNNNKIEYFTDTNNEGTGFCDFISILKLKVEILSSKKRILNNFIPEAKDRKAILYEYEGDIANVIIFVKDSDLIRCRIFKVKKKDGKTEIVPFDESETKIFYSAKLNLKEKTLDDTEKEKTLYDTNSYELLKEFNNAKISEDNMNIYNLELSCWSKTDNCIENTEDGEVTNCKLNKFVSDFTISLANFFKPGVQINIIEGLTKQLNSIKMTKYDANNFLENNGIFNDIPTYLLPYGCKLDLRHSSRYFSSFNKNDRNGLLYANLYNLKRGQGSTDKIYTKDDLDLNYPMLFNNQIKHTIPVELFRNFKVCFNLVNENNPVKLIKILL